MEHEGAALLANWRAGSDEEAMAPMLELFGASGGATGH
jgi:hypothetical protein